MSEPTNQQRAQRVAEYVKDYRAKYDADAEINTAVQDLISDLLHYIEIVAPLAGEIVTASWVLECARDRFMEEKYA